MAMEGEKMELTEAMVPPVEQTATVAQEHLFPITVKYAGKEIVVATLTRTCTVQRLKEHLYEHTRVLPHRQKLMGSGKAFTDNLVLSDAFRPNQKIMMMGSPEEALAPILTTLVPEVAGVVNEVEHMEEAEIPFASRVEYLDMVARHVRDYNLELIEGFRPGKKLVVLDIDYTIFDNGSVGQNGCELMRPFLHEFLHIAYQKYDIVIWSATGKRWIQAKLHELGIRAHCEAGHYKLAAVMDDAAMITVQHSKGSARIKPLGIIWGKYPQFSERNTLIVDDLRRNFLMNPSSGLRINQYRHAFQNRDKDKELVKLAEYLEAIAHLEDFTSLNHRKWEKVAQEHRRKLRREARAARGQRSSGARVSPQDRGPVDER
ncbi:hypothetical protein RvY_09555 [Ramazzottius varieornatus]|uniref:Ubiquitin-like domain-containing CTD phosphatase 1 n=1 Tax=Ramazzottius varieornatus TaxID=947166 RepID=A0A1D1VHM5_RAMVA|nr:hypothetical protein RvY_09555 [Ramazzottius varieornatus]